MKKTVHPNSLANLQPFKPGNEWTGNAGGRPQRKALTDRYKTRLEEPLPDWWRKKLRRAHIELSSKTATWGDAIAAMRVADALDETIASKELADRVEGKPLQGLRISGEPGGEPIEFSTMGGMTFDEKIEELTRRHLMSMTEEEREADMEKCKARIAELEKTWRERAKKKQ